MPHARHRGAQRSIAHRWPPRSVRHLKPDRAYDRDDVRASVRCRAARLGPTGHARGLRSCGSSRSRPTTSTASPRSRSSRPVALDAGAADATATTLRAWLDAALRTRRRAPSGRSRRSTGRPAGRSAAPGSCRSSPSIAGSRSAGRGSALDWQRRGANQEAKLLQLTHAFETLGANRVEFKTDSNNAKANPALRVDRRDVRGHVPEPHDPARRPDPALELLQRRGRGLAGGEGCASRQRVAGFTAALTLCHHRGAIDLPGDPANPRGSPVIDLLVKILINAVGGVRRRAGRAADHLPGRRQPAEARGQLVARRSWSR